MATMRADDGMNMDDIDDEKHVQWIIAPRHLYEVCPATAGSDSLNISPFNRLVGRNPSFLSTWKLLGKHLHNAKKKIAYVLLTGGSYMYFYEFHADIHVLSYRLPLWLLLQLDFLQLKRP